MDPEVVFTENGPVMFMGNFEGIHAVPMNPEGTALEGEPVLVAGTGLEAPAIFSRAGQTHLFTSAGMCCDGEASQYRVVAGRADNLMGPYADRTGRPLVEPGSGDVVIRGDDDWVGPGHVDVVTDDADQDWMLYHAAPRGSAVQPNGVQRRYMMLDRLDWVGGWPVVGDGTPSTTRTADPVLNLPVRLTAVGEATSAPGDALLDAAVRVGSIGDSFTGALRAELTGPDKRRTALPIVTEGGDLGSVPVMVSAGESVTRDLALRTAGPLYPGRYELVISVDDAGGQVRELAVFGLVVEADGSHSIGSGALGSAPLGSLGS